jgi:hypothetical protein
LANKEKIEEAILNRKQMHLEYNRIERIVEPAHLFTYQNSFFFVAFCYDQEEWHTFNVDQIQEARVLPSPSMRAPITWRQVALEGIEKHKAYLVLSSVGRIEISKRNEKKPDWSPGKVSLRAVNRKPPHIQKSVLPIFPKEIQLDKMEKVALCRSPLEEKIYRSIHHNVDVVKFIAEPFAIPFLFDDTVHFYTPDALVFFKEGNPSLLEVKLSEEIHTTENQEKFKAAFTFAEEEDWDFCIIGIESLTSSLESKNRQRFRWGEGLQKAKLEPSDPFLSKQEVSATTDISTQRRSLLEVIKSNSWIWMAAGVILILWIMKLHRLK